VYCFRKRKKEPKGKLKIKGKYRLYDKIWGPPPLK